MDLIRSWEVWCDAVLVLNFARPTVLAAVAKSSRTLFALRGSLIMLIVSVATCAVSKSWARISTTANLTTGNIFANIAMQSRIHRRCARVVVLALMAIALLSARTRFIDNASHVASASIKSRESTWKQKKGTCALDVNLAARNAMGQSLVARRLRSMARNTIKNALLARLVVSAYVVVITRLIGAYSDVRHVKPYLCRRNPT